MWDDRRQVGVLSGFGFARLGNEEDTDGRRSRGAGAFLALDLMRMLRRGDKETPHLYRHGAESFAWSLIYLCFTTVKDNIGENSTKSPNPWKVGLIRMSQTRSWLNPCSTDGIITTNQFGLPEHAGPRLLSGRPLEQAI